MAKKYYWLKLKDNFFTQREIKKLRKIAGGDTFTIIYLKMQLLSIKNEGRLIFEGTEQSILDQLELELDEERDNIKLTIAYLRVNKLLEDDNDDYFLPKACESIGKESESAERVRKCRANKLLQSNSKALPSNECNVTSNTEIEKEKELKLKKELELKLKKELEKKEVRHKHGEYKHVLLTKAQYEKLITDFEEDKIIELIKNIDEWVQMKGKPYKDYNLAIRKWERKNSGGANNGANKINGTEDNGKTSTGGLEPPRKKRALDL